MAGSLSSVKGRVSVGLRGWVVGKVGECVVGIGVGRSNPKSPLIKAGIGASKPALWQEALAL